MEKYDNVFNSWIDKKDISKPESLGANVKVELDLSNYETKTDLKKCSR